MTMRFLSRQRMRIALPALLACAAAAPISTASADTPPVYSIDFYTISAGGNTLQNSCYHLAGTLGQTAPGYSSADVYALIAGYWNFSLTVSDEIFFNGFEEC